MTNQVEYFRPTPPPKKKSKLPIFLLVGSLFFLLIVIMILLLTRERWMPIVYKGKYQTQTANTQVAFSSTLDQLNLQQKEIFTKSAENAAKTSQAQKATQLIEQELTKAAQKTLSFQATATQSTISTATQQFLNTFSDRINQIESSKAAFGPVSSTFIMDNSGYVKEVQSNLKLKNFIVQADFYVPYSVEEGTWDIGFFFRNFEKGSEYNLIITSEGMYYLFTVLNNNRGGTYISNVNNLNLEKDQVNQVLLFVEEAEGYLIVNDQLIEVLDLSQINEAGDIYAFSGAFLDNIIVGKSVKLENFSIWEIP